MVVSPLTIITEAKKAQGDLSQKEKNKGRDGLGGSGFQFRMPLHYPRYGKKDYEDMPEWKLDQLLADYGLPASGALTDKRQSAIGAFLWNPDDDESNIIQENYKTKRSTNVKEAMGSCGCQFQMPLHYPRYTKKDYEAMDECKLDRLLAAYGLTDYTHRDLAYKREFAITTFLWPAQSDSTNHQDAPPQYKIVGVVKFLCSGCQFASSVMH